MCHGFFHKLWIFTISKSQSYEYFDNQWYTTPTQSRREKCNPAFLGNKNFIKDESDNKRLDKGIGRVYNLNTVVPWCSIKNET